MKSEHPDFLRGYGFQGGAWRGGWERGARRRASGGSSRTRSDEPGPWRFEFYGFGECLPRHENYVELDPTSVDAWGIPALRINCAWSDNEQACSRTWR